MPLLLSKVHEVLPKLANPMLQNVPDSVASNVCNVDIFDGFGNAGMAQPPPIMDDYEKKFASPDSNSSQAGGSSTSNDLHSPFMSSPPGMSPGGDYVHNIPNNSYNTMSGVMINQMQSPTVSHNGQPPTSNPPPTSIAQHPTHQSISSIQNMASHIQGGMSAPLDQPSTLAMDHQSQSFGQPFNQGMSYSINGMGQNMNTNSMMNRQPPNRTNSFGVTPNPQLSALGDFQAIQRANSELSTMNQLGMNSGLQVGAEMDFNTLR